MAEPELQNPSIKEKVKDIAPDPELRTDRKSSLESGGGVAEKDIEHILKDSEEGGALPDTKDELQKSVDRKHYFNSRVVGGDCELTRGVPQIESGTKIKIMGVGERFSGEYFVEQHELSLSKSSGLTSTLALTRNALGKKVKPKFGKKPSEQLRKFDRKEKKEKRKLITPKGIT